jgi:hypothetical protein
MFDAESMKQVISGAVLNALSEQGPALLKELVDRSLAREVNQYGSKPEYNDKKMTLLEFMSSREIDKIIQEAVRGWFETQREDIKATVTAKIVEGGIAEKLVDALQKTIDNYGFKVEVSVNQ